MSSHSQPLALLWIAIVLAGCGKPSPPTPVATTNTPPPPAPPVHEEPHQRQAEPIPAAAPAPRLTEAEARKQRDEIEALINQLASTNTAPTVKTNGKDVAYPPDWDPAAQTRTEEAALRLLDWGPAAFPQMMEHAHDERFCFVNQGGNGARRPKSVGDACSRLISCQFDVFAQIGIYPAMYPSYFDVVVGRDANFKRWWAGRENKPLAELQIEAFEWAIDWQKEALAGWKADQDAGESTPEPPSQPAKRGQPPRGAKYSHLIPQLEKVIAANEDQLRQLRESGEPIKRWTRSHPFYMFRPK